MNCARMNCAMALVSFFVCLTGLTATGKDDTNLNVAAWGRFQWQEHTRLSWDDFKGEVNTTHDESAAATCCSIGFKTDIPASGGKPEIIVYNTFYADRSWVRPDARIQSILDHEQGHFDLCEVYTRKLKGRMKNFDIGMPGVKQELMNIYAQVSKEYEARQQCYEEETVHGTNIAAQRRWQDMIARELM